MARFCQVIGIQIAKNLKTGKLYFISVCNIRMASFRQLLALCARNQSFLLRSNGIFSTHCAATMKSIFAAAAQCVLDVQW